ncbi:MAG: Gldg family protein [Marinifilaceae bacterium]|nr:Gldg family protein [Marinifilaceae bacterium]
MNMIRKIAKKELQLLFYSPIAWFLLVVFTIQTAMIFIGKYNEFLYRNEWGGGQHFMASFALFSRIWGGVLEYLYYYIPLLTMGIVSRELSSGSIKLLYSSPVTNTQIILGKFLSMVVYAGVLCGVLLFYVFVAWGTIENFELGAVMTGWLGIFLLTCTYIAVGIFISSLTSYQFVAAVGTFIVLMLLSMIGGWWQEYDVIRDITYWLSIGGRASTFLGGMLCSEDVLYFPIVTAMFLMLTIMRLKAVRQKVRFSVVLGRNVGVIFGACLLGYLSSRPKLMGYYDATSNLRNTLSVQSQDVLKKLEGGLSITAYSNILNPAYPYYSFPRFVLQNREIFKAYERFKPETKLKVVYYYDTLTVEDDIRAGRAFAQMCAQKPGLTLWQRAKKACELYRMDSMMLKTPEEIRVMTDLKGERTFVWEIKRENGQKTWLRTFDGDPITPLPYETETTAALKRLVMDNPKVGIVKGHGMRSVSDYSPRGYSMISGDKDYRQSLLNQGFDVIELDLHHSVPENITILVIADVHRAFSIEENRSLEEYVNRGGNLFILAEPRRREQMNPFLRKCFGVELTEGVLMQYRWDWMHPDGIYALTTPEAETLSFNFSKRNIHYVMMPTAAGIEMVEDKGFKMTAIMKSDTVAGEVEKKQPRPYIVWNELGPINFAETPVEYNPEDGEIAKDYNLAVALSREVNGKEQRVIITGDADCISNGEFVQPRSPNNSKMILASFHYLSHNEMPIDTRREKTKDTIVYLNRVGYNCLSIGFNYVLPLLFLGAGLFLWFRRRGR